MPSPSDDTLVPLRGGPAVPVIVIKRLLALEDRGVTITIQSDGKLHVGPRARVQNDDLAFVREHREDVLACVAYCERLTRMPL